MKIRWLLFLAVMFATPEWVRDADPLDTVREAFRASSRFKPKVKVDPNRYNEASLRMPAGSSIVCSWPESRVRIRRPR
jgi:hypothetical protein